MTNNIKSNWKIVQSSHDEYILLSDSNTIRKIRGKNSHDIISVLLSIQNKTYKPTIQEQFSIEKFEQEYISAITEWLQRNHFIECAYNEHATINLIGEFGNDSMLDDFIDSLAPNITVDNTYNLSKKKLPTITIDNFTLIVGPLFYNKVQIKALSKLQQDSDSDFLYTELYENGLLLGPLMNTNKETVCVNCLETRRIFNLSSPSIIIENLIEKTHHDITSNNVFKIGDFNINKVLIHNELKNILMHSNNNLYNKATFIDFSRYQNQYFTITKAPNCCICNPTIVYNPI